MPKATQLALLSANDLGTMLKKGKIVGIRAGKLTIEFGKRGAVQTYVIPLAPAVVEIEAADEPKPHGRPKKVKDEDGEPKRKPGRPKKVKDEDGEPKRRPGRPKKVKDEEGEGEPKKKKKKHSKKDKGDRPKKKSVEIPWDDTDDDFDA